MRFNEFYNQEVDEIIGVKKYHGLTLDELMKQIANDYDLRVLGQGAFGHVLSTKDPNTVVKVFETDDAYMSFVEYIQQNPNPHYPRIVKSPRLMTTFYKRYDLQPDKFTVLALERLVPLSDHMAQFVADVANARDLHDKPFKLPNGRMNGGDYNYDDDDIDPGVTFRELSRDYPWIPTFWEAVRQLFRSGIVKGNIDMHPGNFMARQDGTIVIIDPVSDPKALERKRKIYDLKWQQGEKPNVQGPHYRKQQLGLPMITSPKLRAAKAKIAEIEADPNLEGNAYLLHKLRDLKLYVDKAELMLGKKQ